ncbi:MULTISPECIES: sugar transferase [Clostridium]|uniref:Sugar transferase n=1 Tax=Clostridium paridis TaxID=2803863 RepID=A0A937FDE7_9CLOT|nr:MULTISPECIES: sugar transferase [Clostridium]MBL4930257.1 sugar transferase [Clostridium paridis]
MKIINNIVKRFFDFFLSLVGLVILSPILIVVCILIKLDSKGPVFFMQTRVGKDEEYFKIFKFRTMVVDAEKQGKQITVGKDSRITKVGAVLRKYKIDELPQLINVLIGNMSLVGPRPEVPKYVDLYTDDQKKVLHVKPGITDLASIKYRDENDILATVENPEEYYINTIMKDKINLNLEYINASNILLDFMIIIRTIIKCFV